MSTRGLKLLAVTACPTGIAHTYMAAEKLAQAARALGHEMKVETQGSIGVENALTDNDVREADGIIIAADKDVDPSRFAGKRLVVVGVAEGIHHPERLIERVLKAPVHRSGDGLGDGSGNGNGGAGGRAGSGGRGTTYKALMNGVSYMIPFVVVGGLLIALSLALGGDPKPDSPRPGPHGSSRRTWRAARSPVPWRAWPGWRTPCRTAGRSWRCWARSAGCRCSSWRCSRGRRLRR